MRQFLFAFLLSTLFSASFAHSESVTPTGAATPPAAATGTTPANGNAPAAAAEDSTVALTPEQKAIQANKALLSQDVHQIHSDSYKKQSKTAQSFRDPEKNEKIYQEFQAIRQSHMTAGNTKPIDETSQSDSKQKVILGSSIGAVPGEGKLSQQVNGSPSFHSITLPTPAPNPSDIPNPNLKPLPPSHELRPESPKSSSPVTAELSDGSQAVFRANGGVSIVTPDGKYHRAPDGVLTLKDGTSFTIDKGMRTE